MALVVLGGCGFQSNPQVTPIDGNNPPVIDASPGKDAGADATPGDARLCFGRGLVTVCLDKAPTDAVLLGNSIDTTGSSCMQVVSQASGGPELCVIAGKSVTVSATVVATGSRALVLIGADLVHVVGTLDASSKHPVGGPGSGRKGAAAGTGTCAAAGAGKNDAGGGGGGAGGSLGTTGGAGGDGDGNNTGQPVGKSTGGSPGAAQTPPAVLRGGCSGGAGGDGANTDASHTGGAGGEGGGAIYLIAGQMIVVDGDIFASGAGGSATSGPQGAEQGGGGGGSGGMIGLDAPTIQVSGRIAANGGAGGGGGADRGGGDGGDGSTALWNTRAPPGQGDTNPQGNGGNGAAGTAIGMAGQLDVADAAGGGGGGGGGLGIVWIDGMLSAGAMISPAPTPH
ncbi:MAG TPA: hypothetical protein VGD37_39365 [Kofleriaceae bacterium]